MPVYSWMPAESALSLSQMLVYSTMKGLVVGCEVTCDTFVAVARNRLLKDALKHNPTHLFWMDSDMTVPYDVIPRLLRHNKDIVSGLYFTRREPYSPVCRSKFDHTPDRPFFNATPPETLSPMAFVGFGCVLMSVEPLKRCQQAAGRPLTFFSSINDPEGEDVYFCRLMEKYGETIYLDPTVECGHIGTSVVTRQTHQFGNGRSDTVN